MNSQIDLLKKELQAKWDTAKMSTLAWMLKYRRRIFSIMMILTLFYFKDVSFSIQMNSPTASRVPVNLVEPSPENKNGFWPTVLRVMEALSPVEETSKEEIFDVEKKEKKGIQKPKEEQFSIFSISEFKPKISKKEQAKRDRQMKYVNRHVKVAQTEMEKYGIPASIKLAQGLIETNAGASKLATQNNNHFGIKCFSRKCKKGHCSNFSDDTHKDFFRKYGSTWESYRAHSQLLTHKRYRKIFDLEKGDYRAWAHGLKKAGYATDKRYAEKLIGIIDDLQLQRYDQF